MQVRSYITERQRQRKKQRRYFWATAGIFAFYFIALVIGWIIFRSPVFAVNQVVVKGNQNIPSDAVVSLVEAAAMPAAGGRTLLVKPLLGFHNMFTWPSEISSSTLAWLPQLANLSVGKDYFSHTITINVTERQPIGIWCFMPSGNSDEQCFWFDQTGTLFERAYDTQGSAINVVHDYSQKPASVNKKILPPEFAANAVSIINVLHAAKLNTNSIALKDLSLQEIDVTTAKGPSLYFSLRFPADNYLQVIQNLQGQSGWSKLSYIDCRTQNRAYYR
jgi:cell division septal protein FtsQ